MGYQQQQTAIHHSEGLPTALPFLNTVLLNHCERICKHSDCNLETHPVLVEVALRLRRIPFESCLHTLMLLH